MENVFVTGATGFIGTNLVLYLAEQGHTVHALHRGSADTSKLAHPKIKLFIGDIADKESIKDAMEGCEGVFHVAAFAKQWSKDKNKFHNVNYLGTINVLEIAQKLGVKKVVFTFFQNNSQVPSFLKKIIDVHHTKI